MFRQSRLKKVSNHRHLLAMKNKFPPDDKLVVVTAKERSEVIHGGRERKFNCLTFSDFSKNAQKIELGLSYVMYNC